jgi:hypothetical protein
MEGTACLPLPHDFRGKGLAKIPRTMQLLLRRFEQRIWGNEMIQLARQAAGIGPRFISVHDLELLPLALRIREQAGNGCRVFFDAREYYPRNFEDRLLWRILLGPFNHYLVRQYIKQADIVVTVSRGLMEEYRREFSVDCGFFPSYPAPVLLEPTPSREGVVRMIHHGFASRSRRLELMIQAMRLLPPGFTLDLMLVGPDTSYLAHLRRLVTPVADRVRFLPAVPFAELVKFSNSYDIGVFFVPPSNFNLRFALPNKFFEFIQARLAVAIGPSEEMAPIVARYDCGVVSEAFTPESLAHCLASLTTADIRRMKANSDRAAGELNSDVLRPKIEALALGHGGAELFA